MFRLLILVSLCWITVAGSTCPKGFKLFERTPTARNNHTKQWCLGVFPFNEDLGNRELARHLCISLNSSMSIPENQKETDYLLESYNGTAEAGIAIDGEMSKRCRILRHGFKSNYNTGECHVKNELFEFDDANSDPSFFKEHLGVHLSGLYYTKSYYALQGEVAEFSACAMLTKIEKQDKEFKTYYGKQRVRENRIQYGDTSFCSGEKANHYMKQVIRKVVCGKHPL